jgi:spermidine/putrescine transport system permease protein
MRTGFGGRIALGAMLVFLYAPILVLVLYSFNASRFGASWTGFTGEWYARLLESAETASAVWNTLVVSSASTLLATVLGTLLAIGLHEYRVRGRALVELLIYLPVIVPDIVIGVATLALYVTVGFPLGRTSIVLAHVAFQISFVALVVRGRLQDFPVAILDAARDLGASQWQTLRFVLLPLLRPGIVAGALLAFALSVDDFVITYFTAGAGASTMSIRIYSMIKRGVTPDVNALSTLLLAATVLLLLGAVKARRGALIAPILLLLVVGCAQPPDDRPPVIDAYGVALVRDSLAPRLHLFTWADYLDPELVEEFRDTYGVEVVIDYYDNNEALIAKLQAGGVGQYDVAVASDYAVEVLRDADLLLPIEHERIPNLENLDARFREMPFDPGNRYTVPYQWGTSGLGIRSDLVEAAADQPLDSWSLVFDADAEVGPFVMMADARETIGAALMYLGYSANSTDAGMLAAAEELLLAQRPRLVTYAPFANGRDLLLSGDVAVAHNFSGDVLMARDELEAIRYVIPREGAILWTDNLAIPEGAPSPYTAAAFINFLLDAEVGARLSNFTRYASPNAAALEHIDEELRNDPAVYPDSAVLERLEVLRDVGDARAIYDRIWTRLRSGG